MAYAHSCSLKLNHVNMFVGIPLLIALAFVNCQYDFEISSIKRDGQAQATIKTEHMLKINNSVSKNGSEMETTHYDNVTKNEFNSAAGDINSLFNIKISNSSMSNILNIENKLQRELLEKAKHDSLESIKTHILMRLKLSKPPNITSPIAVPPKILENFYKNYYTAFTNETKQNALNNHNLKHVKKKSDRLKSPFDNVSTAQHDEGDMHFSSMQQDGTFSSNLDASENLYSDGAAILSHLKTIYVFPNSRGYMSHTLKFKFDISYSEIYNANLYLYIRGWEWMRFHKPEVCERFVSSKREIIVAIDRLVIPFHAGLSPQKENILEFRHSIPHGQGEWIKINALKLFELIETPRGKYYYQDLSVKGAEPWMDAFIVTFEDDPKNLFTVHIEIQTRLKHRSRRSVYLDCHENDREMRCCRYPLRVNFTIFGWHFVVAPTSFDAYFCNGECKVGYLEQYTHTHLASLTTSATPCCSPTKMSALSLLYFDDNHKLVLSVIPNMSVEKCSCS